MERVTVILSGDPRRKRLCERVAYWYRRIPIVKEVFLLYERNPAIAFNKGAKMASCDVIFCAGGDVLVKPSDVFMMAKVVKEGDVLFLVSAKRKSKRRFLFQSGAFAVWKNTIIRHPMPEKPDFMEEVYWVKVKELNFKPYFGELYHIHKHSFSHIFRMSTYRWMTRVQLNKRSKHVFYIGCIKLFFESIKIYLEERRLNSTL